MCINSHKRVIHIEKERGGESVSVSVCVRERERERERGDHAPFDKECHYFNLGCLSTFLWLLERLFIFSVLGFRFPWEEKKDGERKNDIL